MLTQLAAGTVSEHNMLLTACWACDEYSEDGGATLIVPGSGAQRRHLMNRNVPKCRGDCGGVSRGFRSPLGRQRLALKLPASLTDSESFAISPTVV